MGSVPVALPAEAEPVPVSLPTKQSQQQLPPGYRSVEQEEADYKESVKRVNDHAFKEWPNEAGVSFFSLATHFMNLT